jgi:hypothetical protein
MASMNATCKTTEREREVKLMENQLYELQQSPVFEEALARVQKDTKDAIDMMTEQIRQEDREQERLRAEHFRLTAEGPCKRYARLGHCGECAPCLLATSRERFHFFSHGLREVYPLFLDFAKDAERVFAADGKDSTEFAEKMCQMISGMSALLELLPEPF